MCYITLKKWWFTLYRRIKSGSLFQQAMLHGLMLNANILTLLKVSHKYILVYIY